MTEQVSLKTMAKWLWSFHSEELELEFWKMPFYLFLLLENGKPYEFCTFNTSRIQNYICT